LPGTPVEAVNQIFAAKVVQPPVAFSGTIMEIEGAGSMNEVIFIVEEAPEGGYTARAVGESIFTEAESVDDLHERVRDAVRCHFNGDNAPNLIRLHFVRDEVIAA
jgi:hypothetical protein